MKRIMLAATAVAAMIASSAQATLYNVDRSFSNATLTGSLDIPTGNYTIQNASANPFTSVNLTLTVNGTPYNLTNAFTGIISGTGQFFVNATPTTLTFSTANADGGNPADLVFSDNPALKNRYIIGYDGAPGFEAGHTVAGNVSVATTFPTVFGTVIPEPSTFALLVLGIVAILGGLRRRS